MKRRKEMTHMEGWSPGLLFLYSSKKQEIVLIEDVFRAIKDTLTLMGSAPTSEKDAIH